MPNRLSATSVGVILLYCCILLFSQNQIEAFSSRHTYRFPSQGSRLPAQRFLRPALFMTDTVSSTAAAATTATTSTSTSPKIVDRSTLLLLEHINLNIPHQEPSLSTHVQLLGLGLDPRRAPNVVAKKGTMWTNAGPCQFHLPYGPEAQCIPGHVGLRYDTLEPLKQRLSTWQQRPTSSPTDDEQQPQEQPQEQQQEQQQVGTVQTQVGQDPNTGREFVKVKDAYGTTFYCRVGQRPLTFQQSLRQPLVTDQEEADFGEVARQYGVSATNHQPAPPNSECRGIEYVEFPCPFGTADRIAQFYEHVFDATTTVLQGGADSSSSSSSSKVAVIAFGDVDEHGQAEQSLVFREVDRDATLVPYDGHHIALYVGETAKDYEKAFENCQLINLVWVNPRFKDNATDLESARYWKQFRFKEIVDLKTGELLLELEHEVRCVEHEAWPGTLPITPLSESSSE